MLLLDQNQTDFAFAEQQINLERSQKILQVKYYGAKAMHCRGLLGYMIYRGQIVVY